MDYKQAGVDVAAGDALVDWLKSTNPKKFPHQDKIVSGIGGFAALFRADFSGMKEPCLVSCTDGVGTKVKLAAEFGRYREVAQDLVAMCVNDMICCGAQPLFFLDYYATGKLQLESAKDFLAGVRDACHASDCALIGGETAEMPGVYHEKDFDCAGFAVGVVDKTEALGPHKVKIGDRLLGFASSGFHSNGFSLLRRLFEQDLRDYEEKLMRPTALYVKSALTLIKSGGVHALSHITGGGLENLPRVLPEGFAAEVIPWRMPPEFLEVQKRSQMSFEEMVVTLNCGVGMIAVVDEKSFSPLAQQAEQLGLRPLDLGKVVLGQAEASWHLQSGLSWRGANR